MTTQNENCPLTRNASGQENGTAIEARGLSSADNGMPAENLSQGKILAPKQASEAANQRPSKENATAESIVDARAAGGNGTSSKVGRADALTYRLTEFDVLLDGYQESLQDGPLKERVDARNELRLAYRTALLAASLVEQPAAAPIADREPPAVSDVPCFPTVLRKMWSGTEVQQWIDDNIKPLVQERHHDSHCGSNAAPSPADERAAWDNARDSLAVAMAGFAARSGNRDFNAAITVLDAITEPGLPLSWLRTDRAASANETATCCNHTWVSCHKGEGCEFRIWLDARTGASS
ncbi:TPA: hypothetical protein U2Q27_000700 [Burkholderia cepacia]|nr:hypothetical protein [Burkholderia cepacia]HEM8508707.1 hypothetical protein [Burkholderia cepacia]